MKNTLVLFILFAMLSIDCIFAQNSTDKEFLLFWDEFKVAVNNKDKKTIEYLTEFSLENGGDFSSESKAEFMDKVFLFLFEENNLYCINHAVINQEILKDMGPIVLRKEIYDAQTSVFKEADIVYSLNCFDNYEAKFKLINGKFKLVASYYIHPGD